MRRRSSWTRGSERSRTFSARGSLRISSSNRIASRQYPAASPTPRRRKDRQLQVGSLLFDIPCVLYGLIRYFRFDFQVAASLRPFA